VCVFIYTYTQTHRYIKCKAISVSGVWFKMGGNSGNFHSQVKTMKRLCLRVQLSHNLLRNSSFLRDLKVHCCVHRRPSLVSAQINPTTLIIFEHSFYKKRNHLIKHAWLVHFTSCILLFADPHKYPQNVTALCPSWTANGSSGDEHFMEPECSLPCSQESSTSLCLRGKFLILEHPY
jgi:hypothetical protein